MLKAFTFGVIGFAITFATYDQADSALQKLQRNKQLSMENKLLRLKLNKSKEA